MPSHSFQLKFLKLLPAFLEDLLRRKNLSDSIPKIDLDGRPIFGATRDFRVSGLTACRRTRSTRDRIRPGLETPKETVEGWTNEFVCYLFT